MSILATIQSKEADIYISLFFTLLGLVLGAILDIFMKSASSPPNAQQANSINLTFNSVVHPLGQTSNSANSDISPIVFTFLVVTGLVYLFYRVEILNILSWITIFTISLWAGATLHSLIRGFFSGGKWAISLLFSLAFCIAATYLTDEAFKPKYAPENFKYIQELINEHGIMGIGPYFYTEDFHWFLFHLLGVMALFYASIRMMLSSTYFMAAGMVSGSANTPEPWLVRKTRKYADLKNNVIYMSLLMVIAYYLMSGIFSNWLLHSMPGLVDSLVKTILHGRSF